MAHTFDVPLKALFRNSSGVISRLLFGGPVAEWLNVEQPDVSNRRADLLVRTAEGRLRHVELQTRNEAGMELRMLDYYVAFWRLYGEPPEQRLLYVGREPLRMASRIETEAMRYEYSIVNVQELDGEELLASSDFGDNALALVTRMDAERVFAAVFPKLQKMEGAAKQEAAGAFVLLSGLVGMGDRMRERIPEAMVIDLMENPVLAPYLKKRLAESEELGKQQGVAQVVLELAEERFGPLPEFAKAAIENGSAEQLNVWKKRLLKVASVEELLA